MKQVTPAVKKNKKLAKKHLQFDLGCGIICKSSGNGTTDDGKDYRVWRSLVSRLNGVQEALSSNLNTRTKSSENHLIWVIFGTFLFDSFLTCLDVFPVAVSQPSRSAPPLFCQRFHISFFSPLYAPSFQVR